MCRGYAAKHRSAALRQLLLLLLVVWSARLLWLRLLLHYDQGHLRLRWRLGLQPHVCLLLQLHVCLLLALLLGLRLGRRLLVDVQPLPPCCSRSILPRCLLCHPAPPLDHVSAGYGMQSATQC